MRTFILLPLRRETETDNFSGMAEAFAEFSSKAGQAIRQTKK